jgi:hypothetical protein
MMLVVHLFYSQAMASVAGRLRGGKVPALNDRVALTSATVHRRAGMAGAPVHRGEGHVAVTCNHSLIIAEPHCTAPTNMSL